MPLPIRGHSMDYLLSLRKSRRSFLAGRITLREVNALQSRFSRLATHFARAVELRFDWLNHVTRAFASEGKIKTEVEVMSVDSNYDIKSRRRTRPKKVVKIHGGVRPGAGRKPVDPSGTTLIGASLPTELAERLDAFAAAHEMTRARVVREAVAKFLNAECSQ